MPEHPLAVIESIDPEITAHLKEASPLIYGDGVLPKKLKLLIAMAFDAAHGADKGVRALACQAIQEGATKEEIAEVLRVAYHLSGVGTLYTAAAGLRDVFGEKSAGKP
jgi:alkylhydroperoxidase/carboxymuconolactone decarboxylase family protein YurZ